VSVLRCVEHEQVIGIAAIDEIAATSARQFLNLVDVSDPARLARRCPIGRGRKCRAFLESGVIAKSRVWTWSVLLHLRSSVSVRSQHHNPVRIAPMSWMGHLVSFVVQRPTVTIRGYFDRKANSWHPRVASASA